MVQASPTHRTRTWLLLLDEKGGTLLHANPEQGGHVRFTPRATFVNDAEPREHHRPSPRAGHGSHSNASLPHEDEELRRRYAKRVAAWLQAGMQQHGIQRLALFAPARLVGALRHELPPPVASRTEMHHGDLASLSSAQLERHPLVTAWLAGEGHRD